MTRAALAFACASPILVGAQARNNNWILARDSWFSFSAGTFDVTAANYHPAWRNASMSDTAGNFLMLVDDQGIRDALFGLMPGGAAADLGWVGDQANYLILPMPDHPQAYCVFVNQREDMKRAGVAVVDMNLNGGLGGVSSSGTSWFMDSTTAKLAATPHGNGSDYWILQHEDGSNEFHAFQLTSTGIDPLPVISHTGHTFLPATLPTESADFWGTMTFNVQGDMFAMETCAPGLLDTNTTVQLFHFDNLTGEASFIARIHHFYTELGDSAEEVHYDPRKHFGGIEFDPSGDHLYVMSWDTVAPSAMGHRVSQIELDNLDPDSLQYSAIILFGIGQNWFDIDLQGSLLRLGPDGRIYYRANQAGANQFMGWFTDLPGNLYETYAHHSWYSSSTDSIGGFPNPCKRYHDSEPLWLGILEGGSSQDLSLWPNPMVNGAILRLPPANEIVRLHWIDGLGKVVRTERLFGGSGSLAISRGDLPPGFYLIRAMTADQMLGTVPVICE